MIFLTGDIHGDMGRFKSASKLHMGKNDVLTVCGDFGFIWDGSLKEKAKVKIIGRRKHVTMFVDGCNENHKLLTEYPIVNIFGGKARKISGNLYCMVRGEIYDIYGTTMFAFGGGDAGDAFSSKKNDPALLPSGEEMESASLNLRRASDKVDLIVTHDVPTRLKSFLDPESNKLTHLNAFLEDVCLTVKFKQWYFGKYHSNKKIPPCYNMLFTDIVPFEK